MNWKDEAKEIVEGYVDSNILSSFSHRDKIIETAIVLAKLVCEEQKKICYEHAELGYVEYKNEIPDNVNEYVGDNEYGYNFIWKETIINSPTVKFN